MQRLARLRTRAARLRSAASPDAAEVLAALDAALDLTDAMRVECASLQKKNADLEAQVQRRDEEAAALLDTMPYPLVQTDCAGQIFEVNRAGAALLGLSRAKLKDELLLHFSQDRAAFTTLIRELPRDGNALHASARFRPRDRAPFDAAITVLRDPRSSESRWLWYLDRVSAARTSAGTPFRAASVPSQYESFEM